MLSVEGKIFFSIVSDRLTDHLLKNQYITSSVHKGGIPGISGWWRGIAADKAQEGKGDLAVIWLDLPNAYGSIPHKLVEATLEQHHVPTNIKNFPMNYYDNFNLRFTSVPVTSE